MKSSGTLRSSRAAGPSRTSSFAFKDKPRNLREVGQQLGANLVVEGSVLRSGNKLRINAQLVQVAGDVPLWAERFDRELKDVFAIQDEISRAIVNKLRLTLGRGQRRYDTNLEAYELYLKAHALLDGWIIARLQPGRGTVRAGHREEIPRSPPRMPGWRCLRVHVDGDRSGVSRPRRFRSCGRRP